VGRGRRALGLVLLALVPIGSQPEAGVSRHPDSLSRTRIAIEGGLARARISFQSLSLIEVMEGLDANEDLELSPEELRGSREEIGAYLVERLRFVIPDREGVLDGRLESLAVLPEALVGPGFLQWMEAELHYTTGGEPLERFELESLFFREENPLHSDVTTVGFQGERPIELYFSRLDVRHAVVAPSVRRPEVFGDFVRIGIGHALGMQALGLLLVLAVAVRGQPRPRTVLAVFVFAQAAAFFLGSFQVVDYPARLVLLAAALSVAYIGVENLVASERSGLLLEALGFGVVLGAAGALEWSEALEGEPLFEAAACGYAAGFFPLFAAALLALGWGVSRFAEQKRASRMAGLASFVGVGLGLVLFLQRAGWI